MIMKKINYWLIPIFILGLFLRLIFLSKIPAGFHQDEVVNAYIGKFILKNKVDVYGNFLPFFYFDKRGDYPPVVPMYFAGFGSLIFGNTVFGARIVIAFFGFLTLIIYYFFIKKIFNNKKIALVSTLFLTINFWQINFSRTATEGSLALFFLVLGLFFLVDFNNKFNLFLGSFFLYFTYLIYPGYRVLIPLIFFGLLFLFFKNKNKNWYLIFLLTFLSILLTFLISQTFWGKARFEQTSILKSIKNNQDFYNRYIFNEKSVFLARVFNNKTIYLLKEFLNQYFSYFSFDFLFLKGGKPDWFSLPNQGVFYLSYFFLFIVFLIYYQSFFSNEDKKKINLFFYFLIISVIPASLTSELTPHLHRALPLVIFFIVFPALGLLILEKKNKAVFNLMILILVFEFIYCSHQYFQHLSMETAIPRSDGNQKMAVFLRDNHKKFNQIDAYISGWFPIYYLYFSDNYSKSLIGKIEKGMRMKKVDNINFFNKDCPDRKEISNYQNKNFKNLFLVVNSICEKIKDERFKEIIKITNINGTPVYIGYILK